MTTVAKITNILSNIFVLLEKDMGFMDNKLFLYLQKKRDELKSTLLEEGIGATICDDETLLRIAEALPEKEEELVSIQGINASFVSRFGTFVLDWIKSYKNDFQEERELSGYNRTVFEKIENKLKDKLLSGSYISKSSSSITLPCLDSVKELIYNGGCIEFTRRLDADFETHYEQFIKLTKLADKKLFEDGQNELYLGFSVVRGSLCGGIINCYTPLVLIPIKIMLTYNEIKVFADKERAVVPNALLNALCGIPQNAVYPLNCAEELADLQDNIKKFFARFGMPFKGTSGFELQDEVVLDCYDRAVADILMELGKIKSFGKINKLTDIVLGVEQNVEDYMPNTKSYFVSVPTYNTQKALLCYEENDVTALNTLMGAEKQCAITNILADAVCKDKSCLVVSKNSAELEQSYSKLNEFNRYAVKLFGGDINASFKRQFLDITKLDAETDIEKNDIFETNDKLKNIENQFAELDSILFGNSELASCIKNAKDCGFVAIDASESLHKLVAEQFGALAEKLKLVEIINFKKRFLDSEYLQKLLDAEELYRKFPWLYNIKKDIGKKGLLEIEEFKLSGATNKKAIKQFLDKFLVKDDYNKFLQENPQILVAGLNKLEQFNLLSIEKELLSVAEKEFVARFYDVQKISGESLENVFIATIQYLFNCSLKRAEEENAQAMDTIKNFDALLQEYNSLLNSKAEQCQKLLQKKLQQLIKEKLVYSKRYNDINKVITDENFTLSEILNNYRLELFGGLKIWFVSLENLSKLPLVANMFENCILLDSANFSVDETIGALFRSKKLIAVADSEQNVKRNENLLTDKNFKLPEPFELSIFENASDYGCKINLCYDSLHKNAVLFDFANYALYDGKCKNAISSSSRGGAITCLNVGGRCQDGKNAQEARKVVSLLKVLFAKNKYHSLVVVAFTNGQKYEIIKQINLLAELDSEFSGALYKHLKRSGENNVEGLVKTAYEMSGVTKEIVIFSSVVSVNKYRQIEGGDVFDFAGSKALFNLVVTSAIEKLIVISSVEPEDVTKSVGGTLPLQLFATFLGLAKACSLGNYKAVSDIIAILKNVANANGSNAILQKIMQDLKLQGLKVAEFLNGAILVEDKVVVELESVAKLNMQDFVERELYWPIFCTKEKLSYHKIFDTLLIKNYQKEILNIKNLIN